MVEHNWPPDNNIPETMRVETKVPYLWITDINLILHIVSTIENFVRFFYYVNELERTEILHKMTKTHKRTPNMEYFCI